MQRESINNNDDAADPGLEFECVEGGIVDSIIAAYGVSFMQRVATALGGMEVKFPRKELLVPEHPLVVALGMEDAKRLRDLFGGERISVPKGRTKTRLNYFVAAIEAGKSSAEMAGDLGVTMRTVRRNITKLGLRNHRHLKRAVVSQG